MGPNMHPDRDLPGHHASETNPRCRRGDSNPSAASSWTSRLLLGHRRSLRRVSRPLGSAYGTDRSTWNAQRGWLSWSCIGPCSCQRGEDGRLRASDFLKRKYCDYSCAALANNLPAKAPARAVVHTCLHCPTVRPSYARWVRCPSCRDKAKERVRRPFGAALIGIKKGDLFKRSPSWQAARSAIQGHARKLYLTSGLPLVCAVCGYDKHVEVAHRKAVSDFGEEATIGEVNAINNLMALCPNHHWEQEHDGLVVAGLEVASSSPSL